MILSCQNICKSFGEKVILQGCRVSISKTEKKPHSSAITEPVKLPCSGIIMHELSPDIRQCGTRQR